MQKRTMGIAGLPTWFVALVAALCLLPIALTGFWGTSESIGSAPSAAQQWAAMLDRAGLQTLFVSWAAVWIAASIAALGVAHYRLSRSHVTLIIAGIFVVAGLADAYEGAALLREAMAFGPAAVQSKLFGMEWLRSLSHIGCLLLAVAGLAWVLMSSMRRKLLWVGTSGALTIATGIVYAQIVSGAIDVSELSKLGLYPSMIYALSLVIVLGPLLVLTRRLSLSTGSHFHQALVMALIPIALQEAHLAFVVRSLLDRHAMTAQFLQLGVYVTVLGGLILDYMELKRGTWRREDLGEAQERLLEKTRALEQANVELADQLARGASMEVALKKSEAFKSSILEGALDGFITFDAAGLIVDTNSAAEKLLGWHKDATSPGRARYVTDFVTPRFQRLIAKRLSRGPGGLPERRRLILRGRRSDGSEFPVETAVTSIEFEGQRLFTACIRDVTERLKSREEIVAAREVAIRASQAKSEFLANMSHEIRTPLNAIIGMTDLLAEATLPDEQDKYVRVCRRAGRTLLNIVNDVLDLSKIEAGQLVLESVEFDSRTLTRSIIEMMELRATEKGLPLTLAVDENVPRFLRGDPNRVRQILINLVGNAIKFTSMGRISVVVKWHPDLVADGQGQLQISVRDTGAGIPRSQIDVIFEKFTQADSSVTRVHGGTGLGLAISRRLAEAMGGTINVVSQIGKGSEFSVILPMESLLNVHDARAKDYFLNLRGRQVLAVADQPRSITTLVKHLKDWGAMVECATGSRDAIAMAGSTARGTYDLIFVEESMRISEEHQGERSLAVALAEVPSLRQTPVLLLIDESGLKDGRLLGPGEIATPFHRSDVMEVVARALGKTIPKQMQGEERIVTDAVRASNATDTEKRVLLVEDSPDNQALVKAYLKGERIALDIASNGLEACEMFNRSRYDLILMDMQMPILDGYSATRQIRTCEAEGDLDKTTIVALTAHALTEEIKKCIDAGCDGHLAKPVRKQQLVEAIELFSRAKTQRKNLHKGVRDAGRHTHEHFIDDLGRETRS